MSLETNRILKRSIFMLSLFLIIYGIVNIPLKLNTIYTLFTRYNILNTSLIQPIKYTAPAEYPKFCNVHNFSSELSELKNISCVLINTNPTVNICIHPPEKDLFISKSIVKTGGFERHITKEIIEQMKAHPNAGFIDIGANIGIHGLVVAKLGRNVVAVEPLLENIKRIHKAVHLNQLNNYVLVKNVLNDFRGHAILNVGWKNFGANSMEKGVTKVKGKQNVSSIFIDDLLDVISFKEAVLKVDIEGSEPKAFLHADKLFEIVKIHTINMEWGNMKRLSSLSKVNKQMILSMINLFQKHNLMPYTLKYIGSGTKALNVRHWLHWPFNVIWKSKQ